MCLSDFWTGGNLESGGGISKIDPLRTGIEDQWFAGDQDRSEIDRLERIERSFSWPWFFLFAWEEVGRTWYVRCVLDGDEGKSDGRISIQPRLASQARQ